MTRGRQGPPDPSRPLPAHLPHCQAQPQAREQSKDAPGAVPAWGGQRPRAQGGEYLPCPDAGPSMLLGGKSLGLVDKGRLCEDQRGRSNGVGEGPAAPEAERDLS